MARFEFAIEMVISTRVCYANSAAEGGALSDKTFLEVRWTLAFFSRYPAERRAGKP
jgi:hypothetical protein